MCGASPRRFLRQPTPARGRLASRRPPPRHAAPQRHPLMSPRQRFRRRLHSPERGGEAEHRRLGERAPPELRDPTAGAGKLVAGATSCRRQSPGFGILSKDAPNRRFLIYYLYYYLARHLGDAGMSAKGVFIDQKGAPIGLLKGLEGDDFAGRA